MQRQNTLDILFSRFGENFEMVSDTKVSRIEIKSERIIKRATLTRSDGLKINLFPNSGFVIYVMNGDYGLELCSITKIWRPDPTSEVMFTFWRVLSSEQALEVCTHEDDLTSKQTTATRLGRRSLRLLVEQQSKENPQSKKPLVFNEGDFPWEAAACNIVGIVARMTDAEYGDRASNTSLLKKIQDYTNITDLNQIDRVIVGNPFSDVDPTALLEQTALVTRQVRYLFLKVFFLLDLTLICCCRSLQRRRRDILLQRENQNEMADEMNQLGKNGLGLAPLQ